MNTYKHATRGGDGETAPDRDRESRRRQLSRMSKSALAQMCRTGITRRQDGGLSYIEGGFAPVIQWAKDEIIQAILNAEFDRAEIPAIPEQQGKQ